jgi:hypothetical protein
MTHDEYLSRLETATDEDAAAILAHADSCAGCRREQKTAERALASLEGRPRAASRFEEAASLAAVAALLAIAIGGLSLPSSNVRPTMPPSPAARYRIVGGPAGVIAYTPTETIVAAGGSRRSASDEKEIPR